MNLFFDTSSLVKLYHFEEGTKEINSFLLANKLNSLIIAELTIVEFVSTVWKKFNRAEIDEFQVDFLLNKFEKDIPKFELVPDTIDLKILAKDLIKKYCNEGLRSLDAIQLASILSVRQKVDYFFTSDKVLINIAHLEKINVR
jgi:uncharacterized protein